MAFTQGDVDALKAAIAQGRGARTIQFGDQSVTFYTVAEMEALLTLMQRDVTGTTEVTDAGTPRYYRLGSVSKGT